MGTEKIITEIINEALLKRYQEPEWYLGFEVGNSCGCETKRHADAIAICAYPSRGFQSIGFEVKVSRSDLKHELDNPRKCEEMYQYVNEWYLVVPKGLADNADIPKPWGVIEYNEGKLRQKRKAQYHEAKLTTGFMLAFIRGRQRVDNMNRAVEHNKIAKNIKNNMNWEAQETVRQLKEIRADIDEIRMATGINIVSYCTDKNIRIINIARKIEGMLKGNNYCGVKEDIDYHLDKITQAGEMLKAAYEPLLKLMGESQRSE